MMKEISSSKTDKFSFKLKLSEDRLKLFIDAEPVKAKDSDIFQKVESEELINSLPPQVIHDCLHKDVIEEVCKELSSGKSIKERRIAKGKSAEDGKDGRIVFLVRKMSKKAELSPDEHGYVDFKDLHLFENIRSGSIVAKVFNPSEGKIGMDPLGKTIQSKPAKPAKFSLDNTIKSEAHKEGAGFDLIAQKDGYLFEDSGKLSIQEELNISGSVDYKVGSLDFIGTVKIRGDVLPGFIVRGRKGVVISGSVTEATVTSSEGDVEIKGFLSGGISSKIEAKRDVIVSVAQQAEIYAGLSIRVLKEAKNCNFHCSGLINAEKALIISGNYACACGLEAKEIGSKLAAQVLISMSSSLAATEEFIDLENKIAQHEKALSLLSAHLGPMAVTNAGFNMLSDRHKQKLQPLIEKKKIIDLSLQELRQKRDALSAQSLSNAKFRVNVKSILYPAVKIQVLDNTYENKNIIQGPKTIEYDFEKNEFMELEYKPIECQIIQGKNNER